MPLLARSVGLPMLPSDRNAWACNPPSKMHFSNAKPSLQIQTLRGLCRLWPAPDSFKSTKVHTNDNAKAVGCS
jgi:hypothetical protein